MFFYLGFIVIISCLKVGYIGDRISIKLDFEKIRIKSGLDVNKLPNTGGPLPKRFFETLEK